ncbi:MAG: hypothetical protein WC536_02170 [Patescibacteria group bacterium]
MENKPLEFGASLLILMAVVFGIIIPIVQKAKKIEKAKVEDKMSFKDCGQETTYWALKEVVKCLPTISLDESEKKEMREALADYALGDESTIDKWLVSLQNKGKKGILPKMPFSDYRYKDVIYVEERFILLSPNPNSNKKEAG